MDADAGVEFHCHQRSHHPCPSQQPRFTRRGVHSRCEADNHAPGKFLRLGTDAEATERFSEILKLRIPDYKILAAGVSGFGTDQEYLLLQKLWPNVKPAVVVLIFCTETIATITEAISGTRATRSLISCCRGRFTSAGRTARPKIPPAGHQGRLVGASFLARAARKRGLFEAAASGGARSGPTRMLIDRSGRLSKPMAPSFSSACNLLTPLWSVISRPLASLS